MRLVNKTKRMKVIPLPHQTYCKALGRCECIRLPGMKKMVATSLTIPAEGTSKELPEAVLSVAQVARLLKQHQLEIEGTNPTPSGTETKKNEKRPRKKRKSAAKSSETSASHKTRK